MNYGWKNESPLPSCRYLMPYILDVLTQLGSTRVLDIGCGNGAMCAALAGAGYHVVGIDRDHRGIEIARNAYPGVRFYDFGVDDDPRSLLAVESRFDVVVSTEVVEHLYSPGLLPKYSASVLRDSGHLLVSTPYHGYLKNLVMSIIGGWDRHHDPLWHGGHIKFWSPATLTTLLQTHGFRIDRFAGVGRLPYLWKSMLFLAHLDARVCHPVAR